MHAFPDACLITVNEVSQFNVFQIIHLMLCELFQKHMLKVKPFSDVISSYHMVACACDTLPFHLLIFGVFLEWQSIWTRKLLPYNCTCLFIKITVLLFVPAFFFFFVFIKLKNCSAIVLCATTFCNKVPIWVLKTLNVIVVLWINGIFIFDTANTWTTVVQLVVWINKKKNDKASKSRTRH